MSIGYKLSLANEDIILYQGEMKLQINERLNQGEGKISFAWFPVFQVKFKFEILEGFFSESIFFSAFLSTGLFESIQVSVLGPTIFSFSKSGIQGSAEGRLPSLKIQHENPESTSIIYFHIANFRLTEKQTVIHQDGWIFSLFRVEENQKIRKSLSESSGYAVTHIGKIEREGQLKLNEDEASDMLKAIDLFMSFYRGLWSSSLLKIGCTYEDSATFLDWDVSGVKIDSYRGRESNVFSWSDNLLGGNAFIELFSGFYPKWKDDLDSLESIINWYVEANKCSGGIAGSIILAVSALETLSWLALVGGGIVAKKDFANKSNNEYNSTSKKINKLLKEFCIPQDIPDCLCNLLLFEKSLQHSRNNGAYAIVEMRNNIVHGAPENREKFKGVEREMPMAFEEARELSLLYLELCILYMSDYDGIYQNRIFSRRFLGGPDFVPWVEIEYT